MRYDKKGQVFQASGQYEWMHYYAAPMSAVEFPDHIRVYFTTRSKVDADGFFRTYVCFLDIDKNDPKKVLRVHDRPVLEAGNTGAFDEHGTMLADVIEHNGRYYMYYIGWQRSGTVPYVNMIGLAMSDDGENFTKVSNGPIIGLNRWVPYGVGNLTVIVEDGLFQMWYTHYKDWVKGATGFRPNYDIRSATSKNGMDWEFGDICIPANENEAIATPCVRKLNGGYHMWYSYRPIIDPATNLSGKYLIGYATSPDKKEWTRRDETVGLSLSGTGWDSEMICAPDVLELEDKTIFFYCGNMYGRDGFGYAELHDI